MKRVKLIHEDLNAGGGAERLAAASLEALSELDLSVDLVTFTNQIGINLRESLEYPNYENMSIT